MFKLLKLAKLLKQEKVVITEDYQNNRTWKIEMTTKNPRTIALLRKLLGSGLKVKERKIHYNGRKKTN